MNAQIARTVQGKQHRVGAPVRDYIVVKLEALHVIGFQFVHHALLVAVTKLPMHLTQLP